MIDMIDMPNMSKSKRLCIEVEETNKRKCVFSDESENKHVKPNVKLSGYNLFQNGSMTSHDDFCNDIHESLKMNCINKSDT